MWEPKKAGALIFLVLVLLWNMKGSFPSSAWERGEKAIELDHGSAIDYANLAINLLRLGHRKEAAFVLRQALELDASLDFAVRALEELG